MSSFKELFVNIKRKTGAWTQSDLQHDRHWYIQHSTCLLDENKRRARRHTNTNPASDKSERSQRWRHSCNIGNDMLGLWKRLILTPLFTTVTTLCKKKKKYKNHNTFEFITPWIHTHSLPVNEYLSSAKLYLLTLEVALYNFDLWSRWEYYHPTNGVCP